MLENGDELTVHCANPGAMLGLNTPGIKVWLSKSDNPKRKLSHSWELAQIDMFWQNGQWLASTPCTPTSWPLKPSNRGASLNLSRLCEQKREVPYGQNSRIDILLSKGRGMIFAMSKSKMCIYCANRAWPNFQIRSPNEAPSILMNCPIWWQKGHRAVMFYVHTAR